MHEASIAATILERLGEHPDLAGRAIRVVRLRVGRLSTVVPANLEFMFGVLAEGTPLAGARLEIEEVPARAVCDACGTPFAVDDPVFLCPACGSGSVRLESGRELTIDSVETDERGTDERQEADGAHQGAGKGPGRE
ncbi:MAG: hydrogenase maturation nickel metallochaperone HypA [Deltaproteobacteria bacterium]|nr:hydrogenase maturation nickel metallochaperone HypA [Deltaproteobacteria bacterium]